MSKHMFGTTALVAAGAMALGAVGEPRGMVKAKAEAPLDDPLEAIKLVQQAFEEFKGANDEKIDKRAKKQIDDYNAELDGKLSKINASIDKAMEALNEQAEKLAHVEIGDNTDPDAISAEEKAYGNAFAKYMRKGKEDEIEAAIEAGNVRAALSVGSDPDGGYTAPVEWDRTITDALKQISGMRNFATVQNVMGQGFTKLYNKRGTASGWVDEVTDPRGETATSTLAPYTFAFGEIYAMPGATQRILDDSEIDIAAWLGSEVATEFAFQEGSAFVNGDGVNKPKGLMQFTATAEAALPAAQQHPLGGIAEIDSGSASDLTTDGLVDLIYGLPSERATDSAFYMNRTTQGTVRKMKDGDGNYIWQPPFQAGQPATLLGHGQFELLGMANVAANAFPVAFGNMAMTYRIFDRVGVRVLRDPFTAKPKVLFYTTKRVGGGLWNPEYMVFQKIAA